MLNLDVVFDPNRVEAAVRARGRVITPTLEPKAVGPEDLPLDWRIDWEERAAVMEYDGGLPRERAEALALDIIIRQMREVGVIIGHKA